MVIIDGKESRVLDNWKLKDFAPGEGIKLGANTERFDTGDWIDVTVPGDVHQALMAARRIPDPFYDCNESECAWVEEREWWYRSQFKYRQAPLQPDERCTIVVTNHTIPLTPDMVSVGWR